MVKSKVKVGKTIHLTKVFTSEDKVVNSICGKKLAYRNKTTNMRWKSVKDVSYITYFKNRYIMNMKMGVDMDTIEPFVCKNCKESRSV